MKSSPFTDIFTFKTIDSRRYKSFTKRRKKYQFNSSLSTWKKIQRIILSLFMTSIFCLPLYYIPELYCSLTTCSTQLYIYKLYQQTNEMDYLFNQMKCDVRNLRKYFQDSKQDIYKTILYETSLRTSQWNHTRENMKIIQKECLKEMQSINTRIKNRIAILQQTKLNYQQQMIEIQNQIHRKTNKLQVLKANEQWKNASMQWKCAYFIQTYASLFILGTSLTVLLLIRLNKRSRHVLGRSISNTLFRGHLTLNHNEKVHSISQDSYLSKDNDIEVVELFSNDMLQKSVDD